MGLTLRACTVACLVAASLLGGAPGQASNGGAATVEVTFADGATDLPRYLRHRDAGAPRDLFGTVRFSAPVSDVRLEFSGAGLSIDPAVIEVAGPVSDYDFRFVQVAATSGGFHPLTVEVTSSGTDPTSVAGPLYFAAGGDPLPATGDLTGLSYAWSDPVATPTGDAAGSRHSLLTILDGDTAFIGSPAQGRPRCPESSAGGNRGCLSYRYDAASGLVQIGGVAAKVVGHRLWVTNIGFAGAEEEFNERFLASHIYFPKQGKRLVGHWRGSDGTGGTQPGPGTARVELVLRRDGTFGLVTSRQRVGSGPVRAAVAGTYRFASPGRLVLRTRGGRRLVMTLALPATPAGTPRPGGAAWMVDGRRGAAHAVVYRLQPRPRAS